MPQIRLICPEPSDQHFPRKLPIRRYLVRYKSTTAPQTHDPWGKKEKKGEICQQVFKE